MLRVGLTGGIASGKSTVAELFAEKRVPVIDSDALARDVVLPGTPGLATLVEIFGERILNADKTLNRTALRKIVFNDSSARQQVEDILHPAIRELSEQQATIHENNNQPYCLFDIPLLVETGQQDRFDRVLIVDVSEEIQLARVIARDNSSREQALKIIRSQASRLERLDAATDVIINNVMLTALADEIDFLHHKFISMATKQPATLTC